MLKLFHCHSIPCRRNPLSHWFSYSQKWGQIAEKMLNISVKKYFFSPAKSRTSLNLTEWDNLLLYVGLVVLPQRLHQPLADGRLTRGGSSCHAYHERRPNNLRHLAGLWRTFLCQFCHFHQVLWLSVIFCWYYSISRFWWDNWLDRERTLCKWLGYIYLFWLLTRPIANYNKITFLMLHYTFSHFPNLLPRKMDSKYFLCELFVTIIWVQFCSIIWTEQAVHIIEVHKRPDYWPLCAKLFWNLWFCTWICLWRLMTTQKF